MNSVTVVGAGLAGSEAAWQLVRQDIPVRLVEMRPGQSTPAHRTGYFAELICSNSFRAAALTNAVGVLKAEMRSLDSLIMKAAEATQVPAGGALAVNRDEFAKWVTSALANHPLVTIEQREVTTIPEGPTVIASGPLTSTALAERIRDLIGLDYLYFYDAVAPIVSAASLNYSRIFAASRYDKGEGLYLNAPFEYQEYQDFWRELSVAEVAESHLPEEKAVFFEGCMPIEVLAKRGPDTMRYGPLKPVGLIDPNTGKRPYAVVQLRAEDREGQLYNLVGFQTHLKWNEQQRVFRMIPGLAGAEFQRYGVMHRNTYINAPLTLKPTFQSKARPDLFFAGQITGVEGYVESAASGLVAGMNCARFLRGEPLLEFSRETAVGALSNYICDADPRHFQPMNVNFGLFAPLTERCRGKQEQRLALSSRALETIKNYV